MPKINHGRGRNMKNVIRFFVLYMFFCSTLCYSQEKQDQKEGFPVLKGAYLGQTPPGNSPEIFAPGIITTYHYENSKVDLKSKEIKNGKPNFYWVDIKIIENLKGNV